MLEEGCQTDAVVGHMGLLADYYNVVFSCLCVEFQQFLTDPGLASRANVTFSAGVHEANADHPQADHHDLFLGSNRHLGRVTKVLPKR